MYEKAQLIKQVAQITLAEIYEEHVSLDDLADSDVEALVSSIQTELLWGLSRITAGGITGGKRLVVCALPNNREAISLGDSVQCKNGRCNEYFCKKHSLSKCPLCNDDVA